MDRIMQYKPEIHYDDTLRVWSGGERSDYFPSHLSIGEIIYREMESHPKLIAQISATEKTVLTREELRLNAMRVASYMRRLGLKKSDIVGIIARNTTHMVAVAYACFFNGIPFHSLNVAYEQETIETLFGITRPRLIVCDGDEFERLLAATEKLKLDTTIITMRNHPLARSVRIQDVLTTPIEENFQPSSLEPKQTLAILCSSGTTGIPKAVTIANSQQVLSPAFRLDSNVQHAYSTLDWNSGLMSIIHAGAFNKTSIIAHNDFDPGFMCRMIKEYKIGVVIECSSHLAILANYPGFEDADLSSIEVLVFGGSHCSLEVQKRVRSRIKGALIFTYTISELSSPGTMNLHFDEKPNSSGRPAPGTKVKIINEQGVALGPNVVGEVCLFNGRHWSGYYGNPEETRKILDSEMWFHTGDLGYMDQDGFLFIEDRKKDMLKCQNLMYYPNEIETVIARMPNVAEVCVFGIWDTINGDEAAACVVKRQDSKLVSQDVVDFVNQHITAKYRQLSAGVIIVEDLKRSGNGKTNRCANKEHFMKVQNIKESK
ncbi:luciferin 4-monooxygenase-like isoform X1 [Drosophila guanche]|uniref:Blast:Luciferin 4-monooxygenase n=2 Tax=Drosophila guanche TaxID=7266 RepID=A0A3B0JKV7_DROGU|nr:luciferin 4-monooxygenase-like isoform X1 [Drosophila guanche]SPP82855.1 blast:Luciferin 4-monooxygenase [Drosophila guanche]